VPRAELACGRVGDDGNGMVAQLVRPALRLLSRSAACMAASSCICMEWRIVPPCVSVVVLASWACAVCHGPCTSRSWGEVERGGDFSCEAETCRARQRLVVGIPLIGNFKSRLQGGFYCLLKQADIHFWHSNNFKSGQKNPI
jgi:hypothetical protein